MQYKNRSLPRRAMLLAGVAALSLVVIFNISFAARNGVESLPQQDVIRLETRVNQLEQRLYSIDSSLRRLEQQSRAGSATSGGVSQQELELLRSQIQTLQLRIVEHECALAKLDERTLSPTMRDARRKSGVRTDPCRANTDVPLRLPDRRE